MNFKFTKILALGAVFISLLSCEKNKTPDTPSKPDEPGKPIKNEVVVDATDYYTWNYFNLKDGKVVGKLKYEEKEGEFFVLKGDESSMEWDIALHRGDLKTNSGSVYATGKKNMTEVTEIPEGNYVSDKETDKIIVDNSQMMQGIIGYGKSLINPALMTWYTQAGMPPTFEYSKEVFVLKTKDGRHFKIQFTTYKSDPTGQKSGNIAFNYEELLSE